MIFQEYVLTDTEIQQAAAYLSQPVVKKYLSNMASAEAKDLAFNMDPKEGESAESFLGRRRGVHGRLEALITLLSIHNPLQQPSSN